MPSHKRSAWTWIVIALIGVPMLYVLSFGPACWWFSDDGSGHPIAPPLYWPIGWTASRTYEGSIFRAIRWYATLRILFFEVPTSAERRGPRVLLMPDDVRECMEQDSG